MAEYASCAVEVNSRGNEEYLATLMASSNARLMLGTAQITTLVD